MSSYIPAIAFRTGWGSSRKMNEFGSFCMLRALDAMNSGCPVVFLDVRERDICHADTREEIIDKAKDQNKAL